MKTKTQTLFRIDDDLTGDGLVVEIDAKTDRLFVTSRIADAGERVLVVLDAHDVGRRLGRALLEGLGDAPAPKTRATKLPRKVAL